MIIHSLLIFVFQVGYSNNDPKIIGGYYLQCVKELCHAPAKLRTDCGTENGIAAAIQALIHQDNSAHLYGKSTSNQRIEALWSKFRPSVQGWIDYFKVLCEQGIFSPGDIKQTYALRWSFHQLITNTIHSFMSYWNTHHITNVGIPDILFLTNRNCGIQPEIAFLTDAENHCLCETSITGDKDIDNYFQYVMEQLHVQLPSNKREALVLYQKLLEVMD